MGDMSLRLRAPALDARPAQRSSALEQGRRTTEDRARTEHRDRYLREGPVLGPGFDAGKIPLFPPSQPTIQRFPAADRRDPAAKPAATTALLVEDTAETVAAGQMKKSAFLALLRAELCQTADEELAREGMSSRGCPYIEKWLAYYAQRDSRQVERALHKFAPETASATSARDYIPLLNARVRRGIRTWAETGQMPDVPDELRGQLFGGGIAGAVGQMMSSIGGAIAGVASGIGEAFSSVGRLLFKAREGQAVERPEPGALQGELGAGRPLDGGVRSRMESAFGHDFGSVRVHSDARAAELAGDLNARAFTLGEHIAFGPAEYQPGTPIGDALLAHELAHVIQQAGAEGPALAGGEMRHDPLEEDADTAAVDAVVSLWGGKLGVSPKDHDARPRLRSGLKLQRCATYYKLVAKKDRLRLNSKSQVDQDSPNDIYAIIRKSRFLSPYRGKLESILQSKGGLKVEDPEAFGKNYIEYATRNSLQAQKKSRSRRGESFPESAQKTFSEDIRRVATSEVESEHVAGFTDKDNDLAHLPLDSRGTISAGVHEIIHLLSSTNLGEQDSPGMGEFVNEGTTEYFTNVVLEEQEFDKSESGYTYLHLPLIEALADKRDGVVSRDVLAKAYFDGQVVELRAAIDAKLGQGKAEEWLGLIKNHDFKGATALLRVRR